MNTNKEAIFAVEESAEALGNFIYTEEEDFEELKGTVKDAVRCQS